MKQSRNKKYLEAVIDSREYLEVYASEKVTNWVSQFTKLAEFVLKHRYLLLRTLPDIQD